MAGLRMRRHLHRLPPISLPADCRLRRAVPGDIPALAEVVSLAYAATPSHEVEDWERVPWTADRVKAEFFEDPSVEAVFVVKRGGRVAATASAFHKPKYPRSGWVHEVATHPDHRRLGLGAAVTLAVLQHFAAQHMEKLDDALLDTQDYRLPAISLYLRLGFTPELLHEEDEAVWEQVTQSITG